MKAMLLPVLFTFALATMLPAKTCREVVRDASERIVQTIERQKQAGGTERATTRDASGRIIGSATTNPNTGGSSQTTYRDASGRMAGSADTRTSSSSNTSTQYRDSSGRLSGSGTASGKCQGIVSAPALLRGMMPEPAR